MLAIFLLVHTIPLIFKQLMSFIFIAWEELLSDIVLYLFDLLFVAGTPRRFSRASYLQQNSTF